MRLPNQLHPPAARFLIEKSDHGPIDLKRVTFSAVTQMVRVIKGFHGYLNLKIWSGRARYLSFALPEE
jgi:hypothetical protein